MPDDLTYRIRIAEIYEQSEGVSSALQEYEDILENNPALFPIAYKIYELSLQLDSQDDVLAYWRELTGRHPGEVIPWLFYGIQNEAHGNTPAAVRAYEKVLHLDPDNTEALFRQGALLLGQDTFDSGKALLLQAVSIQPSIKERVINLFYEEALQHLAEQNYPEVIQHYESIVGLVPDDFNAKMHLADACCLHGSENQARELYKEILFQQPENYAAAKGLDALFSRQYASESDSIKDRGLLEQSLTFWHNLSAANPDKALPMVYQGITFERSKDNEKARNAYECALKIDPKNATALYRLGALDILDGQMEGGISRITSTLAQEPGLSNEISKYCGDLAEKLALDGKTDIAVRLYRLALEISPDDLWPLVRLGDLYEEKGDLEAAIASYFQVLLSAPESPYSARRMDALLQVIHSDPEERLRPWRQLLEQYPQSLIPRIYLGATLRRNGDFEGARNAFLEVLKIDSDHGKAIYRLGALNILEGDFDSGYSLIQKTAQEHPELASNISKRCDEVAAQFISLEQYALAIVLYELALDVAPNNLWPKVHLAELYEQLGEFEDALNAYYEVLLQAPESPVTAEKMDALQERMAVSAADTAARWRSIVEKNPHAAIPLFHLGMALEKTQNLSEALDAYNQALAINPGLNEAEARRDRINLKE